MGQSGVLGMRPLKHTCAVQCDKHPGWVESRVLSKAVRGDPGLEGGRVVQAGEGLLGFRNRNFDVAQGAAFKIVWTARTEVRVLLSTRHTYV